MIVNGRTARPTLLSLAIMLAILKVLGRIVSASSRGRTNAHNQQDKYVAKYVSYELSLIPSLSNKAFLCDRPTFMFFEIAKGVMLGLRGHCLFIFAQRGRMILKRILEPKSNLLVDGHVRMWITFRTHSNYVIIMKTIVSTTRKKCATHFINFGKLF